MDVLDERIEQILRPVIIEGLKYYTDTSLNPQNVNPTVSSYKKYVNAKIELQNKFPVNISKQFKRSFLWLIYLKFMILSRIM